MAKKKNDTIDFTEDERKASSGELTHVKDLAKKAITLKDRIAKGKALIKTLEEELLLLETDIIPEFMDSVGLTKFITDDGSIIEVKKFLIGSIPSASAIMKADEEERAELEERKEECLTYIRENNGESIIKSKAEIEIGKDPEMRKLLKEIFEKEKISALFSDSVHYQTLNGWLKEISATGKDIPFETFSIFDGKKAIIKTPKKK